MLQYIRWHGACNTLSLNHNKHIIKSNYNVSTAHRFVHTMHIAAKSLYNVDIKVNVYLHCCFKLLIIFFSDHQRDSTYKQLKW